MPRSTTIVQSKKKSKYSKRISRNAVVNQKHTKPNASKTTNNNPVARMSRKHLIDSLAEIGILIPNGIT
ncbi:unnamed protein product, partial [Rotaria sp. Silwood1]